MVDERVEPRISVNKLGEYLVATPVRRRSIILNQKRPSTFIAARYREAVEAMISFLERGAIDDDIIYKAIDGLSEKPVVGDFQEQDRDLSIEALASFLDMVDDIELDGLACRRGETDPPPMDICGVYVSVRPEIVLTGTNRGGGNMVGVIKIYLAKTHPLTEDAGSYVGTVLQRFASEWLASYGDVDYRKCHTLDVFAQKIYSAPRAYRRRQNDIDAACTEISRIWPFV